MMDRAGDMVELLVEHATDLRMCDLLEEPRRSDPSQPPTGLAIGLSNRFQQIFYRLIFFLYKTDVFFYRTRH